jgi:hypothetical protein
MTTGGMLMTLTASYVIAHWGWRTAYLAFAAPVFLIVIPSVLVVVRSRPPGERQMSVAEAAEVRVAQRMILVSNADFVVLHR